MEKIFFYQISIRNPLYSDRIGPFGNLPNNSSLGRCGEYYLLSTRAKNLEVASRMLDGWIRSQTELAIAILPLCADYQLLRNLFSSLRTGVKSTHLVNAYLGGKLPPIQGLKRILNVAIQQNDRWSGRLKKLSQIVGEYAQKPSRKLKSEILGEMYALGIRPDGIYT